MHTLIPLKLFTTSNCHLCDQAAALLHHHSKQLIQVEISDNDELLAIYGVRIPVLQRSDNLSELDWPFNTADIDKFLCP